MRRTRTKGRLYRAAAGGTALLLGAGMLSMTVAPGATAATSELVLNSSDLGFILKNIKIAEAHAATEGVGLGQVVPATSVLGNGPNDVPTTATPWGLRSVSGAGNNLGAGRNLAGAADTPFPRLTQPQWRPGYGVNVATRGNGSAGNGTGPSTGTFFDDNVSTSAAFPAGPAGAGRLLSPRWISNLISDMTPTGATPENFNQAAIDTSIATGSTGTAVPCPAPGTCGLGRGSVEILNVAPNAGVAPPYNSMFTFFGQFFDHGLDLVGKSATEFVAMTPNEGPADALFNQPFPGVPMLLSRATSNVNVTSGINRTTPWIDQNQTYGSVASKQVFIRQYVDGPAAGVDPVSTGDLLTNASIAGDIGSWADVKNQAATLLGIQLVDQDIYSVPLLLTDDYGRFLRGPNGFPQMVTDLVIGGNNVVIEGNPTTPIPTSGLVPNTPGQVPAAVGLAYNAVSTGHHFLDDIAGDAQPAVGLPANPGCSIPLGGPGCTRNPATGALTEYDPTLLGRHFVTGDGRGNENIGLSAIHTVFHAEHNRLRADIDSMLTALGAGNPIYDGFHAAGWGYGERLFQAARMVTENEYQHLVFETFVRKIEPGINAFVNYNPSIDPNVSVEFSQAVYRFGHSMLNETIRRKGVPDISLFNGFLNPVAFNQGGLTGPQAAAAIAEGEATQRGNEIDEFVTGALRNNVVGLPLDLASINISRGRDVGVPSLNNTRMQLWQQTGNPALFPYDSWNDLFSAGTLRHPQSAVNFLAAYATWPAIRNATTVVGKRAAAAALMADPSAEAVAFMSGSNNPAGTNWSRTKDANGVPVLVNGLLDSPTGIDDIDLWVGGLAEGRGQLAGMLGTTFTQIFRDQIERLQDGDRFYYISRLAGTNMFVEIENNTLADMFVRNTPATGLAADMFSAPSVLVDLNNLVTGPVTGGTVSGTPATTVTYNGTSPAVFVGRDVAPNNDIMVSGTGDDTMRGFGGNDQINGGPGSDNLQGGTGDDVLLDTGNDGADLAIGGSGHDYFELGVGVGDFYGGGPGADTFVTGPDGGIIDGGAGDDLVFAGTGGVTASGQEGADWMQGGNGPDGFIGDAALPPLGLDILVPGPDVLIGGQGADAIDGGGANDVFGGGDTDLTTYTPDSVIGGNGFDWATYSTGSYTAPAGLKPGQDADLTLVAQQVGNLRQADMDTFPNGDVEGLSGGAGDDLLAGDGKSSFVTLDGGDGALNPADISQVAGLQQLIVPGVADGTTGNIIIGGPGADTITGRGGNDLIDGDAQLQVSLTNTCVGAGTLASLIKNGTISGACNGSNVTISRSIVSAPSAGDVAVFSGNSTAYTVTGATPLFTVVGPDGTDVVRNIETLRFVDGDFAPTALVGNAAIVPTLLSVSPTSGSTAGNTLVTLTGSGFTGATGVSFGGTVVAPITVTDTSITVTTPVHAAGAVDVTVQSPNAGGTPTLTGAFLYVTPPPPGTPVINSIAPTSGTTAGGTSVVITGTDFGGATAVTFDGISAAFVGNSATQITATTPAHAAGAVTVSVTANGNTGTSAGGFTYVTPAPPAPPAGGGSSSGGSSAGSSSGGSSSSAASTPATTPVTPTVVVAVGGNPPAAGPTSGVPAKVTLVFATNAGAKAGAAPSNTAKTGQIVTLKLKGLSKKASLTAKVKINGQWVTLGKVKTNKAGKATLPAFSVNSAGTYLVQLTNANGKKFFVKVVVS